MKRMAATTLAVLILSGCAGITGPAVQPVYTQPCTIYEEFGATPANSIIAAKISNPCAAQRMLVTAAKLPAIWSKGDYFQKFGQWANQIQMMLNSGITYSNLQLQVAKAVAEYNAEAGMALLILSDGLLVFEGEVAVISDMDKRLLLASLNNVRVEVANMGLAFGGAK